MKNLKMLYIALIALVAGVLGACTTDGFESGPQVKGPQVSFLMTNPTAIDFTGAEGEETQRLTLSRLDTTEDLSVYILADMPMEDQPLFSIPEFVEFKAGEATAELVMTIDHAKFQSDKTYTVGFYIDETMATPYGCADWSVSFALNPWELMTDDKGNNAKGKFRGASVLDFAFNVDTEVEVDVDIYKHKNKPDVYKVADPWTPSVAYGFGYSSVEAALADGMSTTHAGFVIDASNPNAVIFEWQSLGLDLGYGAMEICSGYPNYIEDPALGAGTLVDGVITFAPKTMFFYSPAINLALGQNENAILYTNTSGTFRIIMPGVEIADYSLAVAYDGMDVAADNKTTTAKFKFTYGDDVTGIKYMIVNGDQEDKAAELVATLAAGQDENILEVENFEQGEKTTNVKVGLESGIYTIVAAPADKNGTLRSKEALVTSFYFAGMGNTEEHPCEVGVIATQFSVAYPEFADRFPDTTSMAFCIYGTEIKDIKFIYLTTAQLNDLVAKGATLEDLIIANNYNNGDDYDVDLTEVNSEKGWVSNGVNLKAGTEYTIAVMGTNVYGETAVATTTHTTEALPEYTGELVIGNYSMYCKIPGETPDQVFESGCVFNVAQKGTSETEFIVTDFGVESSLPWIAKYDSAAGTFTLDGTLQGYEANGNLMGDYYFYYDSENTTLFGLFAYNSEESQGNDPIVFTVDPVTKQISGLNTLQVEVHVRRMADGGYDYLGIFIGGMTEVAPYVEAQKQSAPSLTKIPFSSVKINTKDLVVSSANKIKVLKSTDVKSSVNIVKKNIKSVKPSVVENYTPEKVKGVKLVKTNAGVAFRR